VSPRCLAATARHPCPFGWKPPCSPPSVWLRCTATLAGAYLTAVAIMQADVRSDDHATSFDPARRRTRNRFLIASTSSALFLDATLMRYAIDLLAPFCVVALLTRSVRDSIGDWLSGERYEGELDPAWAVAVTAVHLCAATVSLVWILTTSTWMSGTWLEKWIPGVILQVASVGEDHGWGRRAVLPGGRRRGSTVAEPAARASSDGGTPGAANLAGPGARGSGAPPRGTSGESARSVSPAQKIQSIQTSTVLVSSPSVARVGSVIHLTATVSASGHHPAGTVLFRRGTRVMGSASLGSAGRAVLDISDLPAGEHAITAEFAGGPSFESSRSEPVILRVTR
jgi:hypothetical protein